MTRYLTKDCDCPDIVTGTGGRRPTEPCEHGNRFQTEAELRSAGVGTSLFGIDSSTRWRRYKKSSEPKRDWSLAQLKVEDEGEVCRVCGAPGIERAHILGRRHDQPISPGSKTLLVLPDRIVPLCPVHHRLFDQHDFDLVGYLTTSEQAQAVLDAGSIEQAFKRLAPIAYREEVERSAAARQLDLMAQLNQSPQNS